MPLGRWKEGLLFEGILPDYPNNKAPQFDFDDGQLMVPHPTTSREEIQNQGIRDSEIPPEDYYPEGYHPELLTEWPVKGDLVVPLEAAPPDMTKGMGQAWRERKPAKRRRPSATTSSPASAGAAREP